MTDPDAIAARRQEVEARHGPWTSHSIELAPGVWTRPGGGDDGHVAAFSRLLATVVGIIDKPLAGLRVLDLACLEGFYSVEFARRGAEVVGVEGREASVAKANLAKEALGLEGLFFHHDDVRNLSAAKYGEFDVVLCLGIMYHLDAPDVFEFAERMDEVCRRVTILETHVSLRPDTSRTYKGKEYFGSTFTEHAAGATEEEKRKAAWASLDNQRSFWPSRPALYNLLADAGFNPVLRLHAPDQLPGRDTLVCLKGGGTAERWPDDIEQVSPLRRLARRVAGRLLK